MKYGRATSEVQCTKQAMRFVTRPGPAVLGNYLAKLGEAQIGLGMYANAEATILEAYELQLGVFGKYPARKTGAVKQSVKLYEFRHTAEPGKGYDAKAEVWRAKLPKEEPMGGT